MRLFGLPGGTRAPWRGALQTMPFDLVIALVSTGTPERTFAAAPRGVTFDSPARGQCFAATPRGQTFESEGIGH